MTLKRDIIEGLMYEGVDKFILIGENVLNFHYSDDCYYEEWADELEEGWIAAINFHENVTEEFKNANIDNYFAMGGELEELEWRTYNPFQFFNKVNSIMTKRLQKHI